MSAAAPIDVALISPADVQASADEATRAAVAFVEANAIAVTDHESLQRAAVVRRAILEKTKEISAKLAKPKSWATGLHKWFCALEASALAPYEKLDAFEADEIRNFNEADTRRRLAAEREEAEQRRRDHEARAATEAAALERANEREMAAAVMEEAIAAPLPVVAHVDLTRATPGVKFRRYWRWKFIGGPRERKATTPDTVTRAMKLIPRDYLCADEKKISAYVEAMKETASIPGIDTYYVDEPVR